MLLLNRVLLHDKTMIAKNLGEGESSHEGHKLTTSKESQTEFNDVIRNFFKRNILLLKSRIDSLPNNDLEVQYRDSNDEDILFLEFNNLQVEENEPD